MQIDKKQHLSQPWKVHELLPDFRIEDVWLLPVTLDEKQTVGELQQVFTEALKKTAQSGLAGWLFRFRLYLGRLFNWEDSNKASVPLPEGSIRARYAAETDSDVPALTDKFDNFVPVYEFKNETLAEIENKTVHAACHFGKVKMKDDQYGVQMAIYVKPKGLFSEGYMLLIKPFRYLIVYPVMLKIIGRLWQKYTQTRLSLTMMAF